MTIAYGVFGIGSFFVLLMIPLGIIGGRLVGRTDHKRPVLVLSVAAAALLLLGVVLYDRAFGLQLYDPVRFQIWRLFPLPIPLVLSNLALAAGGSLGLAAAVLGLRDAVQAGRWGWFEAIAVFSVFDVLALISTYDKLAPLLFVPHLQLDISNYGFDQYQLSQFSTFSLPSSPFTPGPALETTVYFLSWSILLVLAPLMTLVYSLRAGEANAQPQQALQQSLDRLVMLPPAPKPESVLAGSTGQVGLPSIGSGGHIFISYSREQFYFAESLSLRLQQLGVQTWLDVQRLVPGTDWQQGLRDGLASSAGLVLVASRAAIASSYVRAEWQSVLAAKKPIYVAFFESVELPDDIKDVPAVDCRSGFVQKTQLLAEAVRTGKPLRQRKLRVNPLHLPTHLPLALRFILGVLWLDILAYLALAVSLALCYPALVRAIPNPPSAYTLTLIAAIVSAIAGGASLGFLAINVTFRRPFRYDVLRTTVVVAPLAVLILGFSAYRLLTVASDLAYVMNVNGQAERLVSQTFGLFVVGAAGLALLPLGLAAMVVIMTSASLERWMPTGAAPAGSRERANARWSEFTEPVEVSSLALGTARHTWRLHYHPDDAQERRTADDVRSAMSVAGQLKEIMDDGGPPADVHIAILTDRATQDWFDHLQQAHSNIVYVVTATIHIPLAAERFRQNQWVDYRLRSGQLLTMAILLSNPSAHLRRYPFPAVPESLERFTSPRAVWLFAQTVRGLAGYNLGFGLGALLLAIQQGPQFDAVGALTITNLFIGIVLLGLANGLLAWRSTFALFVGGFIVALLAMLANGSLGNILTLYGPSLVIGLTVTPLVYLLFLAPSMAKWLPRRRIWLRLGGSPTLALAGWRQLLPGTALYLLVAVEVAVSVIGPTSLFVHLPISEYRLLASGITPSDITAGPDGNMWFTEPSADQSSGSTVGYIGRITPTGKETDFNSNLSAGAQPSQIVLGRDSNLWFTEPGVDKIGRITTSGVITEFPTPDAAQGLTVGPDGNLWFTEQSGKVGKMTYSGDVSEFPTATDATLQSPGILIAGPDGALWIVVNNGDGIVRMNTDGALVGAMINMLGLGWSPSALATGSDGNVWFASSFTAGVGKITPAGVVTGYLIPTEPSQPSGIVRAPDGSLWFTDNHGDTLGRITPQGAMIEVPIPTLSSQPEGISAGPGGTIWFTESGVAQIGEVKI